MPLHLGAFIPSNSKRVKIKVEDAIDGLKNDKLYHSDVDSLHRKNNWKNSWTKESGQRNGPEKN